MATIARMLLSVVVSLSFAVLSGGCAKHAAFGFPEHPHSDATTVKALESRFDSDTTVSDFYDDSTTPPATRTQRRNDIVRGQMALIDLRYYEFTEKFVNDKQTADFVTELAEMSLGLATATVDSGATKTVLGAVMAGVAGGKASFDKTYYFEKTLQVLLSAMEAQRTEVRAGIEEHLSKQTEGEYPLTTAITDLSRYYLSGTLMGVLQTIQKDAGQRQTTAESNLKDLMSTGAFGIDDGAATIRKWLGKDNANRGKLSQWLDELQQFKDKGGLPVASLLNRGDLADTRKQAIEQFKMDK